MQRGNSSTSARHDNRLPIGNIILIGLMGAGKTTIGKLLASSMGRTFIDSDHEIQQRTGVNIPVIFEFEGEAGFRKRETEVLQAVALLPDIVLATGGGAVLREENRELLRKNGTVIYLRVPVNELKRRTRFDKNRPLLQTDNPQARLIELFNQRDPLYRETAHIILDSGRQSARALVQTLIKKLEEFRLSQPIMPSND
ncbi:MAG: shikimate kinase [Nitrosomonas sp.]|jgi:shikimate kinase/3-dehydroquinate synthase|nr:shikimate kinase [Nitrosomonas sp.]